MAIKTNENFIPFSNRVTFRQPWETDLVTAFWIDTRNTRLLSVKVKCPDPWVASHNQKPDMGIASGIKSPPLARTPPPPPHGIYIDRCISKGSSRARASPVSRLSSRACHFHVSPVSLDGLRNIERLLVVLARRFRSSLRSVWLLLVW